MYNFQITDYISDGILIIEKRTFEIKYVNYEFENLIKKSKNKLIGKKLDYIFTKTSIIYDCILNSKKKIGKFIYDDLKLKIFKEEIKSKLEIISIDDKNLVIFFKTENQKIKNKDETFQNFIYLNNVIANVVDRIRNPLNNIKGSVYLLKKEKKNDFEIIEIIEQETKKVLNLLKFVENEKINILQPTKNNIHEILRNIIDQYENKQKYKIIEKFDPSIPVFYFNKLEIKKALNLIIQNSVNILDEHQGYIEIQTSFLFGVEKKVSHLNEKKKQNFLSISIKDNKSFDDKNINDIFLPLYTNNPKKRGYNFYLLKKIIIENDGDISVKFENGIVEYIITLPIL